jgi:hypothetical protein
MKSLISIILILILGVFLRVNLPPNEISTNIATKEEENPLESLLFKGASSQLIANWEITDYLVFKTACSETLKMTLIAIPFEKWEVLEEDVSSCN